MLHTHSYMHTRHWMHSRVRSYTVALSITATAAAFLGPFEVPFTQEFTKCPASMKFHPT